MLKYILFFIIYFSSVMVFADLINTTKKDTNFTAHYLRLEAIQRISTLKYTKSVKMRLQSTRKLQKAAGDNIKSIGLNVAQISYEDE